MVILTDKDLSQTVFFKNGRYNVLTDKIEPPTSKIFITSTLPYNFDPRAKCPIWRWFVNDVFNSDEESIALLQEWFGYNMIFSNHMEQMIFLFGVPGSGKSTTIDVLRAMLGPDRCCAINVETFTNQFGLAPMVGKYAAIISESQAVQRTHAQKVLEKIKQITGQDIVSIRRLYKEAFDAKLFCKITYVGNELPRFDDEPGALFRRFNLLYYANNYFKSPRIPDRTLKTKLLQELPGIALWALDGLQRLLTNGDFTRPSVSTEHIDDCKRLASPLQTMLTDWCELKPGAFVPVNDVYDLHRAIYQEAGIQPMNRIWFGRKMKDACSEVYKHDRKVNGVRCVVYEGMQINQEAYRIFLGRP